MVKVTVDEKGKWKGLQIKRCRWPGQGQHLHRVDFQGFSNCKNRKESWVSDLTIFHFLHSGTGYVAEVSELTMGQAELEALIAEGLAEGEDLTLGAEAVGVLRAGHVVSFRG